MSFLAPLFLAGLAALGIPVLIHLIQRERRRVIEFPSLMFLRRIPYRSIRRRRIRHWALLAMRLAALAAVVVAFARPFLPHGGLAAGGASGAREVVILLDRSYSMAYGDRWSRARAAARDAVNRLDAADRASLVLFAADAEVAVRSTADRARLLAAVAAAKPGAGATRYGPAARVAGTILTESRLPRRETILITDFQRRGWERADGVRLPGGTVVTPVSVAGGQTANVAVTPVSLERSTFSNQERVTVTAGVVNHGSRMVRNLQTALEIGGRVVQTRRVDVEAGAAASVGFAPFTLSSPGTRGTVRIDPDALPADNVFHFVVSPAEPTRVTIVDHAGAPTGASLYLARALAIGDAPRFAVTVREPGSVSQDDIERSAAVVLNDVPVSASLADRLSLFVNRGGGLLVVFAERAAWPSNGADILPGAPAAFVDRTRGAAGRLGALEYGHPVFEPFRAPRSGDFAAARVYGYRAITPRSDSAVLARFDDGAPALVERKAGSGRVLMWSCTLDLTWSDLALKPVFLPLVHRLVRHLTAYSDPVPWLTVGEVVEPSGPGSGRTAVMHRPSARAALSPSGRRLALDGEDERAVLELTEQGFYEIRSVADASALPRVVASNVDLSESDLTAIDPQEMAAALAGRAGSARADVAPPGPEAREAAQRLWWYLLLSAVVLLAVETALADRLSRREAIDLSGSPNRPTGVV